MKYLFPRLNSLPPYKFIHFNFKHILTMKQIHSFRIFLSFFVSFCISTAIFAQSTTWNGSMNSDWATAANWSNGVPSPTDEAVIPTSPNNPLISLPTSISSLRVEPGAILTVNTTFLVLGANGLYIQTGAVLINDETINIANSIAVGLFNEGELINQTDAQIKIQNTGTAAFVNQTGAGTVNHFNALIEIDGAGGDGIYNDTDFTNEGMIVIAESGNVGESGIYNTSTADFVNRGQIDIGLADTIGHSGITNIMGAKFTCEFGASLSIENCKAQGILNEVDAVFTNNGDLRIGQSPDTLVNGIINKHMFTNQSDGVIIISKVSEMAVWNLGDSLTNEGEMYIGLASGTIGIDAIYNEAIFHNSAGAFLQIQNTKSRGISNITGSFTNDADLFLANNDTIGGDGIANSTQFTNNANGIITIDNTTSAGIANFSSGIFDNYGSLDIGINGDSVSTGIYNEGSVINHSNINIDNTSFDGLWNRANGTFENRGLLDIGSTVGNIGTETILNEDVATFVNNTCAYVALRTHLTNSSAVAMVNDGYLVLSSDILHVPGLFDNNGIILDETGTFPLSDPGVVNTGIFIPPGTPSSCTTISNPFDIGNGTVYSVDPVVYADPNTSIQAGTYDELSNTFTLNAFFAPGSTTFFLIINDVNNDCPTVLPWIVTVATDVITFTGASDPFNWHNPLNWDLQTVPGPCHQVVVPAPHEVLITSPLEGLGKTLDVQVGAGLEAVPGAKMDIKN